MGDNTEIRVEFTSDAKEVLRQGAAMEALIELPAFKLYLDILQHQVDVFASLALRPSVGLDGMVVGEFNKGVFRGLRLAMEAPSAIVAERKALLANNEE